MAETNEVWTPAQWAHYKATGKQPPRAAAEALPSPEEQPQTQADKQAEKAIHTLCSQELNRREIEHIHAPMNKKSTLPVGWPDYTVFQQTGTWLAEIKTLTGTLKKDQKQRIKKLIADGYPVYVCRSFEAFKTIMLERENLETHTYVKPSEITD